MALVLKDRVLESSTSTGTGSFSLTGSQVGFQSFSSIGNGNTTYYTIQGKNADGTLTGEWEVGVGTWYTGNTLSRDTVLESSNSNSLVLFSAGDKDVFCDLPAEKVITSAGDVTGPSSAVSSNFALYDGTTGKLIKDSGINSSTFATAAQGAKADTAVQPGSLGTAAYLNAGSANGVASLDSAGKVPVSQIPALGDLNYQGTWNASTNTPTLTSSVGTKGYYYVVSVAGSTNLNGITDWQVGDWAVYNGSVWQKIDNTDSVTSVNGYTGAVVLTYTDVGAQPAGTYVNSVSATSPVTSTGGTTPTIAIPAATTSVSGYLTNTDWNTFNGKQATLVSGTNIKTVNSTSLLGSGDVSVGVTSVTGTAPVVSSGGATPAISMAAANATTNGYLTSTDWATFNGKGSGTVTSVTATSPITSTGGATPVIAMPAATTSVSGYLTNTDWTTFNGKYSVGGALGTPSSGVVTNLTGTASININGTVGATTASTGAFTYISTSSSTSTTPTLSFNASNSPYAAGATISSSYLQHVIQNKSGTASASTNYVLSNDLGTDSTYYGEFGMNSSVYSSGTPVDFFSLNNGIYFSGHDGDLSIGSGNGFKTYFAWGTTGDKAHVINASGAIGLNTNITGTTNFGTSGQVLTSAGSTATPTWTTPATGTVTSVSGTGTVNGITLTGTVTSSGNITLGGTLSGIGNTQLTNSSVTFNGVAVALGGTGTITANTTNALTIGTGLSGTSFNGSGAITIAIDSTVTTLSGTQTLTNKRITSRVSTTTSSATPTINTDTVDMYGLTAQAVNITSFSTNLSGTPTDGQKLWIYIVGTAARTIAWGTSFEASTVALPTTTVTTARLDVGFVWNAATTKWRCVAVA